MGYTDGTMPAKRTHPKRPGTALEFFARLASLDPEQTSVKERAALVAWYEQLTRPAGGWRTLAADPAVKAKQPDLTSAAVRARVFPPFVARLHEQARELIGGAVDGKWIELTVWVQLGKRRLMPRPLPKDRAGPGALEAALQADPMPFKRCPECHTVFVRAGKRKFCSQRCLQRAFDRRRYKDPVRRESIRTSNRNRQRRLRQAARLAAAKGKK